MTQIEMQQYLIRELLSENEQYKELSIPHNTDEQKHMLRALMNMRMPKQASEEFLRVQNEYLKLETAKNGITDFHNLTPVCDGIYIWQGDITTLKCDAIVNAANSKMLGCFCPNHGCIDNAIHTFSGVQLRLTCAEIMKRQGHKEETGKAKITPSFNLPCKNIIHTVGPIVYGKLTNEDCVLLASCYRSCLKLADKENLESIAFCCISTGEFHFPNDKAAEIAVETVQNYKEKTNSKIEVIFNVFKNEDYKIYRKLLG